MSVVAPTKIFEKFQLFRECKYSDDDKNKRCNWRSQSKCVIIAKVFALMQLHFRVNTLFFSPSAIILLSFVFKSWRTGSKLGYPENSLMYNLRKKLYKLT